MSVNILMPQGTMAPALTAGELTGRLGKKPVKILSVLPDDPPRRVIVLLDSSGSVLSTPLVWRAYLAMARNLVTSLPESTTVTLAVFAEQIDMVIPVTNDRAALDSKLKSLEAGWGFFRRPRATALWDALRAALDTFSPPRQGDVVYAFTDGVDDASRIRFKDLENTFRSKPIRLVLISVHDTAQPRAYRKELQRLQDLAVETGGATADISGKGVEKKSQSLSQFMPRLYRMEIELPARLKNPEKSRVTVTGPTIEGLGVNYSGRLAPCPNATPENAAPGV